MTAAQMRSVSTTSLAAHSRWTRLFRIFAKTGSGLGLRSPLSRSLAQVRTERFSELWFTAAVPVNSATTADDDLAAPFVRSEGTKATTYGGFPNGEHKPPSERTIRLGQTLRTLSPLLPNILSSPLPQEILSPHISLHLFPSTHPHLPVVKGRIPYKAALWTAPVAWGCVPVVGNVKLEIVSEKMVRAGHITAPSHVEEQCDGLVDEKLVVRWRTESKRSANGHSSLSASSAVDNGGINRGLSTLLGGDRPLFGRDAGSDSFTGLFVFSFDEEGRIANHTIEHADEASGFDKTNRVVALADWLLGKARWRNPQLDDGLPIPGLACKVRMCRDEVKKELFYRR